MIVTLGFKKNWAPSLQPTVSMEEIAHVLMDVRAGKHKRDDVSNATVLPFEIYLSHYRYIIISVYDISIVISFILV